MLRLIILYSLSTEMYREDTVFAGLLSSVKKYERVHFSWKTQQSMSTLLLSKVDKDISHGRLLHEQKLTLDKVVLCSLYVSRWDL